VTEHDTSPLYPQDGYPGNTGPEGQRPSPGTPGYQRMRYEQTTYQPSPGTVPGDPDDQRPSVKLNAGRLWAGGVMTAVVVALLMIVGVSLARGIFAVPVPVPSASGGISSFVYVLLGVVFALVATALVQLLVMAAPRPLMFFGWIVFLCTVIAVLAPFQNSVFGSFSHIAMLNSKLATGAINLCVGIAIGSLVSGIARSSTMVRRVSVPPQGRPPVGGPLG
jgi:hypothetical protein